MIGGSGQLHLEPVASQRGRRTSVGDRRSVDFGVRALGYASLAGPAADGRHEAQALLVLNVRAEAPTYPRNNGQRILPSAIALEWCGHCNDRRYLDALTMNGCCLVLESGDPVIMNPILAAMRLRQGSGAGVGGRSRDNETGCSWRYLVLGR